MATNEPTRISRERAHYDEHRRYLLHFLERDQTEARRWLVRRVLATWDRQLAFVPPTIVRGKHVVEVGCGNPRILQYFLHRGAARATGVDLAPAFVARGLARPHNYAADAVFPSRPADIEMIYGDFTGPACHGLTADTICCFQSLHHIPLEDFVDACDRVLPPGGHVVISDPVGDHPLRRLGNAVGRASGLLSPDEKALSSRQVIDAFARAGFSTLDVRALNPTLEVYFHLTELLTPLSSWLSFWLKLPMAVLRPLENWLEAAWLPKAPRLGWRYFLLLRKDGDGHG